MVVKCWAGRWPPVWGLLFAWLSLVVSMMVSFCAVFFFPRGVLDEILNLIESVSEGFPSYSFINFI